MNGLFFLNRIFKPIGIIIFLIAVIGMAYNISILSSPIDGKYLIALAQLGALFIVFSKEKRLNDETKYKLIASAVLIFGCYRMIPYFLDISLSYLTLVLYFDSIVLWLIYIALYAIWSCKKR